MYIHGQRLDISSGSSEASSKGAYFVLSLLQELYISKSYYVFVLQYLTFTYINFVIEQNTQQTPINT